MATVSREEMPDDAGFIFSDVELAFSAESVSAVHSEQPADNPHADSVASGGGGANSVPNQRFQAGDGGVDGGHKMQGAASSSPAQNRKPRSPGSGKPVTAATIDGAFHHHDAGRPNSGKMRSGVGMGRQPSPPAAIHFFSGNPSVERTEGILHLYKEKLVAFGLLLNVLISGK